MKHIYIFLFAVIIQECYHYGAHASPTSTVIAKEEAESAEDGDDNFKSVKKSRKFTTSSSSGPIWTTSFSGPETGGSVVSFSNVPFSSKSVVHTSKSESTAGGTKVVESHIVTLPDGPDDVFAHRGSLFSDEDDDMMPFKGMGPNNNLFRTRMLGFGPFFPHQF